MTHTELDALPSPHYLRVGDMRGRGCMDCVKEKDGNWRIWTGTDPISHVVGSRTVEVFISWGRILHSEELT